MTVLRAAGGITSYIMYLNCLIFTKKKLILSIVNLYNVAINLDALNFQEGQCRKIIEDCRCIIKKNYEIIVGI